MKQSKQYCLFDNFLDFFHLSARFIYMHCTCTVHIKLIHNCDNLNFLDVDK